MPNTGIAWPVRLCRWGGPLVAAVLVGSLVLSSCAEGQGSPDDDDNPPGQGAEEAMTSESTTDEASGSGGGLIDVEGGLYPGGADG